jgi:hypothetical protein
LVTIEDGHDHKEHNSYVYLSENIKSHLRRSSCAMFFFAPRGLAILTSELYCN